MSKTDKTAPLWVQLADGYHKSRPWHRQQGPHQCDLPEKPGRANTRCQWIFVYTGKNVCSCFMCSGGWDDKRGKQERKSAKRDIEERSRELHNRLTDCPVCGVHMHAVGVNHDDC